MISSTNRAANGDERKADFKRQLVLLFLGFLLTTVAGTIIASVFSSQQAARQREAEFKRTQFDKYNELVRSIIITASSRHAAMVNIGLNLTDDSWSPNEMREKYTEYYKTRQAWNSNFEYYKSALLGWEDISSPNDGSVAQRFKQIEKDIDCLQKSFVKVNELLDCARRARFVRIGENKKDRLTRAEQFHTSDNCSELFNTAPDKDNVDVWRRQALRNLHSKFQIEENKLFKAAEGPFSKMQELLSSDLSKLLKSIGKK